MFTAACNFSVCKLPRHETACQQFSRVESDSTHAAVAHTQRHGTSPAEESIFDIFHTYSVTFSHTLFNQQLAMIRIRHTVRIVIHTGTVFKSLGQMVVLKGTCARGCFARIVQSQAIDLSMTVMNCMIP